MQVPQLHAERCVPLANRLSAALGLPGTPLPPLPLRPLLLLLLRAALRAAVVATVLPTARPCCPQSWLCGKILGWAEPAAVALHSSCGYETPSSKRVMRWTVILFDALGQPPSAGTAIAVRCAADE